MVLTVSFALSRATGLVCHPRVRGVSGPLGLTSPFRKLDASVEASGPHDFAVRFGAVRLTAQSVHRIPPPTFVTTAKRPSFGCGMAWVLKVFLSAGETNYFCRSDWTAKIRLNRFRKLGSRFMPFRVFAGRAREAVSRKNDHLICPTRLSKNSAFSRVDVRFSHDESYVQDRREPGSGQPASCAGSVGKVRPHS
jgi:hypothetical protein